MTPAFNEAAKHPRAPELRDSFTLMFADTRPGKTLSPEETAALQRARVRAAGEPDNLKLASYLTKRFRADELSSRPDQKPQTMLQ